MLKTLKRCHSHVQAYLREIARIRSSGSGELNAADLVRFFPRWSGSLRKGASSMRDEQPWLTFAATELLEGYLRRDMRVFEWGSGGSTLFLGRRAGEVVAVENDPEWARQVRTACADRSWTHVTLESVPVDDGAPAGEYDAADPETYASGAKLYAGRTFRRYVEAIDRFPDGHFDLITVDGRARPSCLMKGLRKVKPGGLLLLDNSERAWYQRAKETVSGEGWKRTTFFGPGPYNYYFWETVIWQRPL